MKTVVRPWVPGLGGGMVESWTTSEAGLWMRVVVTSVIFMGGYAIVCWVGVVLDFICALNGAVQWRMIGRNSPCAHPIASSAEFENMLDSLDDPMWW